MTSSFKTNFSIDISVNKKKDHVHAKKNLNHCLSVVWSISNCWSKITGDSSSDSLVFVHSVTLLSSVKIYTSLMGKSEYYHKRKKWLKSLRKEGNENIPWWNKKKIPFSILSKTQTPEREKKKTSGYVKWNGIKTKLKQGNLFEWLELSTNLIAKK